LQAVIEHGRSKPAGRSPADNGDVPDRPGHRCSPLRVPQ
jgi:hypothetical protein